MQRLEVSGAVGPIYRSLGVKRLITFFQLWFTISSSLLYHIGVQEVSIAPFVWLMTSAVAGFISVIFTSNFRCAALSSCRAVPDQRC